MVEGLIGLHPVWMTLQPTEGVGPYVRKNRQMRPSNAVRTVWNAEAIDTSHLSKVQSVDQRMRLGMRCRLSPTADVQFSAAHGCRKKRSLRLRSE